MRTAVTVILTALAAASAPAFAQTTCEPSKPCSTSNFSYTPGDTSIRVFGEVTIHIDGRDLRELYESSDDLADTVTAAFGTCYVAVDRFRGVFPTPTEDPGYRLRIARENVQQRKDKLPAFPAITGTDIKVARDTPGLAVVDMRWYETGLDQWFSYRVVASGERFASRKMCSADNGVAAMEVLGQHSVEMPVAR
jgi:hypothetical protein